jgi:Na+/H+-translocating membrane pyrophosphatase
MSIFILAFIVIAAGLYVFFKRPDLWQKAVGFLAAAVGAAVAGFEAVRALIGG